MYEAHFGINRAPFKITPDTSLFFEGGKRGDILAALEYAIHRGEGIIKVVGEVGSGKTMLCRMLQLKLSAAVEIVYIANPSVSPQDILFVIAHELSLSVTRDASKHEVMHLLQDYLLQRHMENKQVVLFVEEAQSMPLETLEEIRLLSNLETDLNKLLQIILFGQPELNENLAQQSIRQLRERITHDFELEPLTKTEIHKYLNFRMRQVGYTGPELISMAVAKKVEQYSEGLLRRINIIADKLLLSAFAEDTHNLTAKHVQAAVVDSAFNNARVRKPMRFAWLSAGCAVVLVMVVGVWQLQLSGFTAVDVVAEVASQAPAADTEPAALRADPPPASNKTTVNDRHKSAADVPAKSKVVAPTVSTQAASAQQPVSQLTQPQNTPSAAAKSESLVEPAPIKVLSSKVEARRRARQDPPLEIDQVLRRALERASPGGMLASAIGADFGLSAEHSSWLDAKLRESRDWLGQADRDHVSIQVLMRNKSAVRELVHYLRYEWPLDLSKTYLYSIGSKNQGTYRVYYDEFDSMTRGRKQLKQLPVSVKKNSPYLDSVYRMQQALL